MTGSPIHVLNGLMASCQLRELTEWLVEILQPQLRTDFYRRKNKPTTLSTSIKLCQRGCFRFNTEFDGRYNDKVYVHFRGVQGKGWPGKNLLSQVSDPAARGIQRVTQSE